MLLLRRALRRNCIALSSSESQVRRTFHRSSVCSESSNTDPGMHQTPIVGQLWKARQANRVRGELREFERNEDGVLVKHPADSATEATYRFSSDEVLKETYRNPWGHVRVGRVLEDLDALAGTIAFEHCADPETYPADGPPLHIVTASVDRVVIKHRANLDDDMTLSGKVIWVGSSSMQIQMHVRSDWGQGFDAPEPWLSALCTFVALKPEGGAVRINALAPTTPEEHRWCAAGEEMARQKKAQRTRARQGRTEEGGGGEEPWLPRVPKRALAAALLERARVQLDLPVLALQSSLAPHPTMVPGVMLEQTALSNSLICQPQHRNTAGRVFGGFLMRRAFELAFASAYLFMGQPPRFVEIDTVDFLRPVQVGDLVRLRAHALYTSSTSHCDRLRNAVHMAVRAADAPHAHGHANEREHDLSALAPERLQAPLEGGNYCSSHGSGGAVALLHVQVKALVTRPEQRESEDTNNFVFTFAAPPGMRLPVVLPHTSEQAASMVDRYQEDVAQVAMEGWRMAKEGETQLKAGTHERQS